MEKLLWLLLIGIAGCSTPEPDDKQHNPGGLSTPSSRPADDGTPYSFWEVKKLVHSWRKSCGESRADAGKDGILYDAGGAGKLVIIHVADLNGRAITKATMDVRFYYEGGSRSHKRVSADGEGIIRFRDPGWFGPDRMAVYVIKAAGYKARRVLKLEPSKEEQEAHERPFREWLRTGQRPGKESILQIERRIVLEAK